jgi:transposase InsO family protein
MPCALREQSHLELLRRQRWPLWRIAMRVGRGLGTVSRCMKRLGLSRLASLEPPVPLVRYERAAPGELLHLDTKKLGRIDGVGHRITGDRTLNRNRHWLGLGAPGDRRPLARVLRAHQGRRVRPSCADFLREAVAYYASLGVRIDRVMTDNGSGYVSKAFRQACVELGVRHLRTRPYTPKTNGKQSASCRPACASGPARPYESSAQREACSPSCTATTGIGHTLHSTASRP